MGQKKNFFLWNIINMVKIIYFQKRCSDLLLLNMFLDMYIFQYYYMILKLIYTYCVIYKNNLFIGYKYLFILLLYL